MWMLLYLWSIIFCVLIDCFIFVKEWKISRKSKYSMHTWHRCAFGLQFIRSYGRRIHTQRWSIFSHATNTDFERFDCSFIVCIRYGFLRFGSSASFFDCSKFLSTACVFMEHTAHSRWQRRARKELQLAWKMDCLQVKVRFQVWSKDFTCFIYRTQSKRRKKDLRNLGWPGWVFGLILCSICP